MQLRVRTREADPIDTGRHLLAMIDPAITFIGRTARSMRQTPRRDCISDLDILPITGSARLLVGSRLPLCGNTAADRGRGKETHGLRPRGASRLGRFRIQATLSV